MADLTQDPNNPYGGGQTLDDFIRRLKLSQPQQPATSTMPNSGTFDPNASMWSNIATGGMGLLSDYMGQNEARARLGSIQGPVYQAANAGATSAIQTAGNMDPNAFAADRFARQQALVNPMQQKQIEDVRRSLQARGIGGLGVYNPGIEGFTPNGQVVSPELAAAYAGINSANNKSAYASMDEGQTYLNNLLQRSGMLTNQARTAQQTGFEGVGRLPSRAASFGQMAQGIGSVLKQPGAMGMLGQGVDWLGNKTGLWDSNFSGVMPSKFDENVDWGSLYG